MVNCALCGFEYTPGGEACASRGCPLAVGGCRLTHCPQCGYASPSTEGGLTGWLSRLLSRRLPPVPSGRLADMAPGSQALVDRVDAAPELAAQLTLLGITPGSRISLTQRFPSFVVDVEGTEVALERPVAETVWIRPEAAA